MLVELVGIAGCVYGIYYFLGIQNGRYKYKRKWENIMEGADIKNALGNTYEVLKTVPEGHGCFMEVKMPPGLSFSKLKELEHIIESGLNANVTIKWNRSSGNAEITIRDIISN